MPVREHRFLSLEFSVMTGSCVDFDVMLEQPDETAVRLYGPSRKANGVKTVLPLPAEGGVCYVTFDNYSAWMTSVCTLAV